MDGARAQELLEFVQRNFANERTGAITVDTALLTEQIIDSMGITLLAAFVEERFGVTFDGPELRKGRLETVSAIAALLDKRA
jgi:acyl carrier protein